MSQTFRYSLFIIALTCMATYLLFAGAASAQETETFVSTGHLNGSSHPYNFILPGFNTALGTLESVDLTMKFNLRPAISVDNDTNTALNFADASLTLPIDVTGPDGFDYNTDLAASLDSGTAKPGMNTFWLRETSTKGNEAVNPSAFDFWESQTKQKVVLTLSPGVCTYEGSALGSGGLFFGGKATDCARITVQYTYQAVPEPAGKYFSVIVAVAVMLMLIGRKKPLRI